MRLDAGRALTTLVALSRRLMFRFFVCAASGRWAAGLRGFSTPNTQFLYPLPAIYRFKEGMGLPLPDSGSAGNVPLGYTTRGHDVAASGCRVRDVAGLKGLSVGGYFRAPVPS